MALVGEVVAKFRAETSDYMSKTEAARNKNRELAKSFIETAGSADRAIATLQTAKKYNGLGEFGIDPRAVQGITAQIRQLDREMKNVANSANQLGRNFTDSARRAGGFGDIGDSFQAFTRGDFLQGIEKYKKGMADISELGGGSKAFKGAVAATAIQLVGNELSKATGKASDLVAEYRKGNISLGEMSDKLAGQIPIYGGIWQTGRNIREMITGENAEAQKMLETANKIKNAIDGWHASLKTYQAAREKFAKDTLGIQTDNQVSALRDSAAEQKEKELAALQEKYNKSLAMSASVNNDETYKEQKALFEKALAEEFKTATKGSSDMSAQADAIEAQEKYNDQLAKATEEADKIYQDRKKAIDATIKAERESGRTNFGGEERELQRIAKERDEMVAARKAALDEQLKQELDQRQKARDELAQKELEQIQKNAESQADSIRKAEQAKQDALKEEADKAKQEAERLAQEKADQIKREKEEAEKAFKERADALKNANKTELEIFQEKVKEATTYLSGADLGKFVQRERQSLMDEMRNLETPQKVYSTPQVSELRSGQSLFTAPTTIAQKQLERLGEIKEQLAHLTDATEENVLIVQQDGN